MGARAVAQYQKKRIIIYNDNGTINFRLTACSGPKMLDAMSKVSKLLVSLPYRPLTVFAGLSNVKAHDGESIVMWDGLRVQHRGTTIVTIQFAYQVGKEPFPVKATEVGGKEVFFGRKWPALKKYLSDMLTTMGVRDV